MPPFQIFVESNNKNASNDSTASAGVIYRNRSISRGSVRKNDDRSIRPRVSKDYSTAPTNMDNSSTALIAMRRDNVRGGDDGASVHSADSGTSALSSVAGAARMNSVHRRKLRQQLEKNNTAAVPEKTVENVAVSASAGAAVAYAKEATTPAPPPVAPTPVVQTTTPPVPAPTAARGNWREMYGEKVNTPSSTMATNMSVEMAVPRQSKGDADHAAGAAQVQVLDNYQQQQAYARPRTETVPTPTPATYYHDPRMANPVPSPVQQQQSGPYYQHQRIDARYHSPPNVQVPPEHARRMEDYQRGQSFRNVMYPSPPPQGSTAVTTAIPPVPKQAPNFAGCNVNFGDLEIRVYERILGDNPSCSSGPPIGIGWNFYSFTAPTPSGAGSSYRGAAAEEEDDGTFASRSTRTELVVSIDKYERTRGPRCESHDLVLARQTREELLVEAGYTRGQMAEAVRQNLKVKHQRRQTVTNIKLENTEQMVERALRSLKRIFLSGDKRRKARSNHLYMEWLDKSRRHESSMRFLQSTSRRSSAEDAMKRNSQDTIVHQTAHHGGRSFRTKSILVTDDEDKDRRNSLRGSARMVHSSKLNRKNSEEDSNSSIDHAEDSDQY